MLFTLTDSWDPGTPLSLHRAGLPAALSTFGANLPTIRTVTRLLDEGETPVTVELTNRTITIARKD